MSGVVPESRRIVLRGCQLLHDPQASLSCSQVSQSRTFITASAKAWGTCCGRLCPASMTRCSTAESRLIHFVAGSARLDRNTGFGEQRNRKPA